MQISKGRQTLTKTPRKTSSRLYSAAPHLLLTIVQLLVHECLLLLLPGMPLLRHALLVLHQCISCSQDIPPPCVLELDSSQQQSYTFLSRRCSVTPLLASYTTPTAAAGIQWEARLQRCSDCAALFVLQWTMKVALLVLVAAHSFKPPRCVMQKSVPLW